MSLLETLQFIRPSIRHGEIGIALPEPVFDMLRKEAVAKMAAQGQWLMRKDPPLIDDMLYLNGTRFFRGVRL